MNYILLILTFLCFTASILNLAENLAHNKNWYGWASASMAWFIIIIDKISLIIKG